MKSIDWREASRWWSLRVSALGSILFAAMTLLPDQLLSLWNAVPAEVRAMLPERANNLVGLILFIAAVIARVIPQKAPAEKPAAKSLMASKAGKVKPKAGLGAAVVAMIAGVIAIEGGYVNHKADPGGETNMGITKRVAVANGYTGPMRALPRPVVEGIYYQRYIVDVGYAPLVAVDAAVTEELFDTTVNMGPSRPSRWFQLSINTQCGTRLTIDGQIGAATIAAYRACQGRIGATKLCTETLNDLDRRQAEEYARLINVNPTLAAFKRGWIAHRIGNVDRRKCGRIAA